MVELRRRGNRLLKKVSSRSKLSLKRIGAKARRSRFPLREGNSLPLHRRREMDWGFVRKAWDKWASLNIASPDEPLKAALLINYDPTGPSRLLSTIAEEEGIKVNPIELSQFVDFIKCDKQQTESFVIGTNQYVVTSIHDNWFCARCMNTSKHSGEGAIVMQTAAFLLVGL
ncbi:unnamed protein product [Malus baccata var. baccata]